MSITPFNIPIVPKLKKETIYSLARKGSRIDKRKLDQFREIKITLGAAGKAHGSALVELGHTKVLAGVKIEPGRPFSDMPDQGVLNVSAEFLPIASSEFEPGPPDENAIEVARVVDRALRESQAIDLGKLAIIPGEKVWVVWVDINVLDHDGNLFDASMLAAMAALLDAKIPQHEILEDGSVRIIGPPIEPLPVKKRVVSVTIGALGNVFLVDPSLEEEAVLDTRIMFSFDEEGNLVGMQKTGAGWLDWDKVAIAFNIARNKYTVPLRALQGAFKS